jgi:dipeptidyl aminopeptidase/acylaminoacyl peptidase
LRGRWGTVSVFPAQAAFPIIIQEFAMTIRRMLSALIAAALLSAPGLLAQESGTREVRQYTIEQFLKTVNYRGASFSPDNRKLLVSSDITGIFNAYALPVDGGEPVPLTDSGTDTILAISYFPDDERFLYTADQGGNELNHVYVRQLDGTSRDLTPGENLKAAFAGWSHDDRSFYVTSNERNPRYFDVYEYDTETLQRQLVFQNDEGYTLADVSPDGKVLALNKTTSRDDSDIYLYDREAEKLTHLTPHEGEVNHRASAFSLDGRHLYFVTDADSDFLWLARQDLETGERQPVARPDWDVGFAGFSKHGKYLAYGINEDARSVLKLFLAETMEPVELPDTQGGNIGSFSISADEAVAAMYVSSDRAPGDLYYLDLSVEEGSRPLQLTRSLNEEIDAEDLVSGKVVRFKSFDGLEIPGILYKPHTVGPDNRLPALVWVHGGPGGQSRIGYNGLIQFLVNHGYVVFAINNRGSSGYGKTFERLDNRNHGKNDLMDCVSSKRMLIETGYADAGRIGIIGGSYGGYMVLAALTFQPQEFEIGVDIFGISNWYRTVQSIPPWWEAQRKALEKELGDFSDEEYFRSISPLFHAEQIVKPLLVLQSANDPRVIKEESDDIVAAVRNNGVPVEYLVFDDEGHGFRKKVNQLRGYQAILDFCDKHLKQAR